MTGPRSAGFRERAHQQPDPGPSGPRAFAVLALGLLGLARELAKAGFVLDARSSEPLKFTEEGRTAVGLAFAIVVLRIVGCGHLLCLPRDPSAPSRRDQREGVHVRSGGEPGYLALL